MPAFGDQVCVVCPAAMCMYQIFELVEFCLELATLIDCGAVVTKEHS